MLNFPQYCSNFQDRGVTGKDLASADMSFFTSKLELERAHATHIFGALKVIKSGLMDNLETATNQSFSSVGLFKPQHIYANPSAQMDIHHRSASQASHTKPRVEHVNEDDLSFAKTRSTGGGRRNQR